MHSVTDLSHEFTFFFDGRFGDRYLAPCGITDSRNWATLHKYDLTGVHLLVLQSGATPCPYSDQDIQHVEAFLRSGGTVLVLGDHRLFRSESEYRLNSLCRNFGVEFRDAAAKSPIFDVRDNQRCVLSTQGSKQLHLNEPQEWQVVACDSLGSTVAASRSVGDGSLIVSSRGLVGSHPNNLDTINFEFWHSLLNDVLRNKGSIRKRRQVIHKMPEILTVRDGLPIEHTEYLRDTADAIFHVYQSVCPLIEQLLGVPKSEGNLTKLILLPTDGGGFSSGDAIGIGVWWGQFPDNQYDMIELVAHEATHAWVLPFPEPMWNEAIATYVGIRVGRSLGYPTQADRSLKKAIAAAQRHDPAFTRYDLGDPSIPHEVAMGKPMWIWSQLEAECPDILARYFREKRKSVSAAAIRQYTPAEAVTLLSRALGRDLVPWFQSLGIHLNQSSNRFI